jgi:hypothetical protein
MLYFGYSFEFFLSLEILLAGLTSSSTFLVPAIAIGLVFRVRSYKTRYLTAYFSLAQCLPRCRDPCGSHPQERIRAIVIYVMEEGVESKHCISQQP